MAKKTHDWKALFIKFRKSQEKTGISLKEWCKKNDLAYNSARRSFNQIKKDMIASADQPTESDQPKDDHVSTGDTSRPAKGEEAKPAKRKRGGQPGNTNAVLHGLFSKRFGQAWEVAQYYDWETRYKVLQAQSLQCEMFALEYQQAIDEIQAEVALDARTPNEEEYDRILKLQDKIERCGQASRYIIEQLDRLDSNVLSREYTAISSKKALADIALKRVSTRKVKADAIHRERENAEHDVDSENKRLQGKLLQANIDKANKQAEFTAKQIKELDGDGTDHDDIDDLFDEIMEERDGLLRDIPEEA